MNQALQNLRAAAIRIVEGETILPAEKCELLAAAGRKHQVLVHLVETLRRRKEAVERAAAAGMKFDAAITQQAEVVREKQSLADGRKMAPFLGDDAWRELDKLYLAASDVQKTSLAVIAAAHEELGETADVDGRENDPTCDPYDWKQVTVN